MAVWLHGVGKHTSAVCMYISRYQNITRYPTRHLQPRGYRQSLAFRFIKTRTNSMLKGFTITCLEIIYLLLYTCLIILIANYKCDLHVFKYK